MRVKLVNIIIEWQHVSLRKESVDSVASSIFYV